MDDEFDDILLDDYNIDTLDKSQPNVSSLDGANDESQETTTPKRPQKKRFNAELLLEPKGIPLLKAETQYIKFNKTRGHEHEDLKRLMTYYTVWANNLYPGLLIQDFSRRVVNPAKSKLVRSVMDQWSNEYRERRQVRLDVRNELSGKTVGDEDGSDGNQSGGRAAQDDDESSEDDNRPLFFPITNTNQTNSVANTPNKKTAKPKAKPKVKPAVAKPRTKAFIDTDDEQPLFTPSQQPQQNNKRKVVFDDSSDEEDTHNMSRSSALALIIERKRKREQAQREEQERSTRPKASTSRAIIEDYDDDDDNDDHGEDKLALFDHSDKDENIESALSDSELAALGIPTQKSSFSLNDADPAENVQLALTDAELLELGLPVNKPAIAAKSTTTTTPTNNTQQQHLEEQEEQFSDNELFDIQEA
ncbi:unnamed protein product [Mucor fragilis]